MPPVIPKRTGATNKQSLDINGFRGINAQHTRKINELSDGKNFVVNNGVIDTRGGYSLVSAPFTTTIKSLHMGAKVSLGSRMLAEVGTSLWYRLTSAGSWVEIISVPSANYGFGSCTWTDPATGTSHLILAGGTTSWAYNIDVGTGVSQLINLDLGDVPFMEFCCVYMGHIFVWGPNSAYPNRAYYCGVDTTVVPNQISKDYWPEENIFKISDASEPILNCIPFADHLLIITKKSYYRLLSDEQPFLNIYKTGDIGAYGVKCSVKLSNYAFWLTDEKQVVAYEGNTAEVISDNIEILLADHSFTNVFTVGFANQFWLVLPNSPAGYTTCFIFDTQEKAWFKWIYAKVFTSATVFGEPMGTQTLQFGTSDGKIIKMDSSTLDGTVAIESEFIIGPVNSSNRKNKFKKMYFVVEPITDYTLSVYSKGDREEEKEVVEVAVTDGTQESVYARLSGVKGQNVQIRVNSTDRVTGLKSASLVMIPGRVK